MRFAPSMANVWRKQPSTRQQSRQTKRWQHMLDQQSYHSKQGILANKSSFLHQHQAKSTTLSKYIWDLKMQGTDYELKWEVLKQCSPYRCGARVCDLCLTEKLIILQASEESTLNKHSEIMQKCRHRNKFKLKSVK